jgi:hypothetical protein
VRVGGARLLARLAAVDAAGPQPLAPDEAAARRVWAQKMVARIRRGDLEAHYRRAWLLTALLEDWFLLRRRWYRGPKEALRWLEAHAPEAHAAFAAALDPGADVEAIARLAAQVTADEAPDGGAPDPGA